ncbi:MAG: hypothetical protein AABY00_03270 [Nanoarchaeota archaeon]
MISKLLNVPEGELLLIRVKQGRPVIGITKGVNEHRIYFNGNGYSLLPSRTLEGVLRAQVNLSGKSNYRANRIVEMYSGRENIARYLEQNSLNDHAAWVRNLKRPYRLPPIETVHFLNFSSA